MNKKYLIIGLLFLIIFGFLGANFSQAISFANPISSTSFMDLLNKILEGLRSLIAVLAVIFIVVGGIMYMISTGNQNMMERAKKIISAAVIGLVIALSAETFMRTIFDIIGYDSGSTAKTVGGIATDVLKFLLSIVGVLGIIAMVIGGGMMLTAYGNEERVTKGKKILTYAIIGVIVSLSALIIVRKIAELVIG